MTKNKDETKIIQVNTLDRVEGEGALYIKIRAGTVEEVRLKIFEPPRFFEAFLQDRDFMEVPDITARICGICPVAYQMSSVHAMENALGIQVDGSLRELRRLLYCGEWIESHALHIFMLHAPDFLGYDDAIKMAKDHGEVVERGLKLKKAGNDLMAKIGGREIHPINVRVGGFYKVFPRKELEGLVEQLKWARDAALETVRWTAGLNFPELELDHEFVALRHPSEYPLNEGRLVSSAGLDIDISEFDQHIEEEHVAHSNALHSRIKGRGAYLVGPMARFNLNFDRLSPMALDAAREAGLSGTCKNPFKSIVIRSIEVLHACDEALRILQNYEMPERPHVEISPRAGTGHGCTEAPRGILYHQYSIDDDGKILRAAIVPPTSQNQKAIESDLRQYVQNNQDLPDDRLTWECEQTIRNYDPCISCATHFLKLEMDRQ
jgi:coenzyme F420-reducing hydrogenase alpha subunit